jgi:hypothetical protein
MSTTDALAVIRASGRKVWAVPGGKYRVSGVWNCDDRRLLSEYALVALARGLKGT